MSRRFGTKAELSRGHFGTSAKQGHWEFPFENPKLPLPLPTKKFRKIPVS